MRTSIAFQSSSRCQTAQTSRSRGALAPGVLHPCFTHPESRGGRSAEKRSGAAAPVGHAMTRRTRRLARRLASHDAGRSPLGAPPWRFWASGPRFRFLGRPPSYNGGHLPCGSVQRAPRSQVVVPGGRLPGPPWACGYEPPAAGRHSPLRLQDRLRRRPSMSEDGELTSTYTIRSQELYPFRSQKNWAARGLRVTSGDYERGDGHAHLTRTP
jgi:hypothetical protein